MSTLTASTSTTATPGRNASFRASTRQSPRVDQEAPSSSRSSPDPIRDAHDIVSELIGRQTVPSIEGIVYDPADPVGKLLFNVRTMIAELERALIVARTKDGRTVAKARGPLKRRQPKLTAEQQWQVIRRYAERQCTPQEIGELFGVSHQTGYRVVQKARKGAAA